ncbi:MAG: winged helix-turn-helix domain-containing protein [Bryobacteraceae bacterium]
MIANEPTRPRLPADFAFGNIAVDFDRGRLTRDGTAVPVPLKELQLLRYLVARRGGVVTREELLREVWDYAAVTTRTVDVHVAGLRQKIEEHPRSPRFLLTVRGGGYMFRGDDMRIVRDAGDDYGAAASPRSS